MEKPKYNLKQLIMETKEVINKTESKLKNIIKKISNVFIIALAILIGFIIGYYYYSLTNQPVNESPLTEINTIETTSIAISERNELMIIDREDGTYQVYQDSVGLAIFNLYATKKYQEVTK